MLHFPAMRPPSWALARRATHSILLLTLATAAVAAGSTTEQPNQPGAGFAIVGVNVIPMDEERVLENQTVIAVDGPRPIFSARGV